MQSKNKIVNATNGGSSSLLNSNVVAGQSKNKIHIMQQLVVPVKMCLSGADTLHQHLISTMMLQLHCWQMQIWRSVCWSGLFEQHLFPPPLGHLVLPYQQMQGSGKIGRHERLDQSTSDGKLWMSTIELQMMTALLMQDGRNEASVAISFSKWSGRQVLLRALSVGKWRVRKMHALSVGKCRVRKSFLSSGSWIMVSLQDIPIAMALD